MENRTDCPLPPRRFRSKWGKLLFSLYDSYIIYALAVIVLTMCYTAVFTIRNGQTISSDEFMVESKATILNFDQSISNDSKGKTYLNYNYTLSYYYKGRALENYIQVNKNDIPPNLPTEVGAEIVIYVHSENPTIIQLFPAMPPPPSGLSVLNIIGILIFAIVPAWIIQQRRAKRLAMLPMLEMGLPIYAEITKKNISALSNSAKEVIQYPLEYVAFNGETYKTVILAAPRAFHNKPVLLLYNLSNPNEFIVPNTLESPPKFNADSTISPSLGSPTVNAILISLVMLGIIAYETYDSYSIVFD
jgi:hypothetical protein